MRFLDDGDTAVDGPYNSSCSGSGRSWMLEVTSKTWRQIDSNSIDAAVVYVDAEAEASLLPMLVYFGSSNPERIVQSVDQFLADRTIGRAFGTLCRLSVCRLQRFVLWQNGIRPSKKLSEGVNRKPGSKSSFWGSPYCE